MLKIVKTETFPLPFCRELWANLLITHSPLPTAIIMICQRILTKNVNKFPLPQSPLTVVLTNLNTFS